MRIRVACHDCGEMYVDPQRVTIRKCVDDGAVSYRFCCLLCELPTVAPTEREAAARTIVEGARLEAWSYPLELAERRVGAPLTVDDVRALSARMADDDWLAELVD
jgi:hypothetical protein